MLQHDPDPSQSLPDAAHTRVKVDVLAKAIAAIEERRADQARQLEGTAMVGDVVKDLQLDISPEELLAEAEAQQKAALNSWNNPAQEDAYAGAGTQARTERESKAFWATIKVSVASVAAIILVFWFASSQSSYNPDPNRHVYMPPMSTYTHRDNPWAPTHSFFATSLPLGRMPASISEQGVSRVRPLSDVADEQPFGCSTYTLERLLRHDPLAKIMLYNAERDMTYDTRKPHSETTYPTSGGFVVGPLARSDWTLIKHKGQIYLRGWVQQSAAQQNSSEKIVSIFNVQSPMKDLNRFVPITLLLSNLDMEGLYQNGRNSPYDISVSNPSQQLVKELLVHGLHLDSHTWEKWQP